MLFRKKSFAHACLFVSIASARLHAQDTGMMNILMEIKPYLVEDTSRIAKPYTAHELHGDRGIDSVRYGEVWLDSTATAALCRSLIQEAAEQGRSVLFDLVFTDNITMEAIMDISRTIIAIHRDASIDRERTRCFVHVSPRPIREREAVPQAVEAKLFILADGSLMLDGVLVSKTDWGAALKQRGVTLVRISGDKNAIVQHLVDVLGELSEHRIKGVWTGSE